MNRLPSMIRLFAVFSLLVHVICPDSTGAAVAPAVASLGQIKAGLVAPTRIDIDGLGNLYVADPRQKSVLRFDQYGRQTAVFQQVPVSGGGVAVSPDGKRLYVADKTAVAVLDPMSGQSVGVLGSGPGEFQYVYDIDVDASGYVFVADAGARTVKVYDPKGRFINSIGAPGNGPGKFWSISAMAVHSPTGEIYVADPSAQTTVMVPKIQVFSPAGALVRTLSGTGGFGPVALSYFSGIAFDAAGRLYVGDSLNPRFVALGLPAAYLSAYGAAGYAQGQLQGPRDIEFDLLTGRLFVVCEDGRIEIFGIDGAKNPIRVNRPPTLPLPLSPVGGSEASTASPELSFRNASDPDGDRLTYAVKILKDSAVVAEYGAIAQGADVTAAAVRTPLLENARYTWSVRASDGEAFSDWTTPQVFHVNAVEEPPGTPLLVAPAAGEPLDGEGVLRWQEAADPDPFDSVDYLVEISREPSFAAPVVAERVPGTSQELRALSAYEALEDGTRYFWRVTALDSHGLRSAPGAVSDFIYDTTLLTVLANVPGARVFLGGNLGYPGRYAGEAPLQLRDFPAGASSVVIERAGFEPYVAQIDPQYRQNAQVYAPLVPAIVPADLGARQLEAGGVRLRLGSTLSPFLVDFDNDGISDLLLGDGSGAVSLSRGSRGSKGGIAFGTPAPLPLPLLPGAAPFVADWNNDGRKDLLVGGSDGTVLLFLNTGAEEAPLFAEGSYLQAGPAPISVGSAAVPCVADVNGDGAKDLVVGSGTGEVLLYLNGEADAAPRLSPAVRLLSLSSPAAPFAADWDGDGNRELLIAAADRIHRALPQGDGSWAVGETIPLPSAVLGGKGQGEGATGNRLFACDLDGEYGKDVVLGTGKGELFLLPSSGRVHSPAFQEALKAKAASMEADVQREVPGKGPLAAAVSAKVALKDFEGALTLLDELSMALPGGTVSSGQANEMKNLLR